MTKAFSLSVLAVTLVSLLGLVSAGDVDCLATSNTLEELTTCVEGYHVFEDFYEATSYATAQPSASEITAWNSAVYNLLDKSCIPENGGTGTGGPVDVPGLRGDYQVGVFTDNDPAGSGGGKVYCVLIEARTINDRKKPIFKRGWGMVITPAKHEEVERDIHFSAPHPSSDENTFAQTAALFKRTNAKSMIVTGRHRKAYATGTSCSQAAPGDETHWVTDGAHDNNEPFYLAMNRIREWQNDQGGCPLDRCAYLQIHGKKETRCPEWNVFLSSGRGNSASSETCYANTALPIRRILTELNTQFPGRTHGIPSENETCDLTATRNIFGRISQGIAAGSICTNGVVIPCASMGPFVHIEQDDEARKPANWNKWAAVINAAF